MIHQSDTPRQGMIFIFLQNSFVFSGGTACLPMDSYALRSRDIPLRPVSASGGAAESVFILTWDDPAVFGIFSGKHKSFRTFFTSFLPQAPGNLAQNDACFFVEITYNHCKLPEGPSGGRGEKRAIF